MKVMLVQTDHRSFCHFCSVLDYSIAFWKDKNIRKLSTNTMAGRRMIA